MPGHHISERELREQPSGYPGPNAIAREPADGVHALLADHPPRDNNVSLSVSVSGAFALTLHTPIGDQQGRLVLIERDGVLSGTVTNPKGSVEFTGGTIAGGHVEFEAKLPTPLGRVKASVSADIDGDVFTGTAKIPLGKVAIEGVRVPDSAASEQP